MHIRLALPAALLALAALVARANDAAEAGSTNSAPAPKQTAPARFDESAFRIVSERNIFNANRSGGTVRSTNSRRPPKVEIVALVGTMAYEKGAFAFFEGSSTEFTKALKPDGVIAGYKVVDILANGVKLEMDGQITELAIGSGLRREDQGPWKVAETATTPETSSGGYSDSSGRSGESNGRYSRNGRSRRGEDSNSERFGSRGSESGSSTASNASAPSADQSDILKKLMERREKESQ